MYRYVVFIFLFLQSFSDSFASCRQMSETYFLTDDQSYATVKKRVNDKIQLELRKDNKTQTVVLKKDDFDNFVQEYHTKSKRRLIYGKANQYSLFQLCRPANLVHPESWKFAGIYLQEHKQHLVFLLVGIAAGIILQSEFSPNQELAYVAITSVISFFSTLAAPQTGNVLEHFHLLNLPKCGYICGAAIGELAQEFAWQPLMLLAGNAIALTAVPMLYSHIKIFHHETEGKYLPKFIKIPARLFPRDARFPKGGLYSSGAADGIIRVYSRRAALPKALKETFLVDEEKV